MNPSDELEDTADSTLVENKPETAPPDQETERPPAQSGGATSSTPSATQSGGATSSSLAMLQRIAASFGEGNVPKRGLPPRPSTASAKKPKLAHPNPNPAPNPNPNPNPNPAPNPAPNPNPNPAPNPDPNPAPDPDADPNDPHLFDVFVSNSDRLAISYEVAGDHFPASSSSLTTEQSIQITDPLNRHWASINYVCFDAEEAFILTQNWESYAIANSVRLMDTIQFFRPDPRLGPNHFTTHHVPWPDEELLGTRLPDFLPHNFLFQVELNQGDVQFGRLMISKVQVRQHFPGINQASTQEMMKLTDYRDKDWFVAIVYTQYGQRYMIIDGWEGFVREHELGAGDLVRFYKPDILAHDKHFLIQFVKREKGHGGGEAGPSQGGGASSSNSDQWDLNWLDLKLPGS